jgi:hypothetical protein
MDREAQNKPGTESRPLPPGPATRRQRQQIQRIVLLAFGGLGFVGLAALLPIGPDDGQAQTSLQSGQKPAQPPLFPGWGRPDLALVLSGEERGYLQPCGCSKPQLGGLARRYNVIQGLQQKGWPVVALDLGDIAPRSGPQRMLKYTTAMKGLDLLGYTAMGIGPNEMTMPLIEALALYSLNNPTPRVVAGNLQDRGPGQLYNGMVESWAVASPPRAPRVGVIGLIGARAMAKVKDPNMKLAPSVRQDLGQIATKKVDLLVLLYTGSLKEATACAKFCQTCRQENPALPAVDVILCLSEGDEPPAVPERLGRTQIVCVGHKGRYVGVVGAFRTGQAQQPFLLRYQLVPVGEEYETPKGKEATNPLIGLMEDYAREVKHGPKGHGFLDLYPRSLHPIQLVYPAAEYVGSDRCFDCHKDAARIWKNSGHAHAYASLEKATRPSLRQYDGECVGCHVVGFKYKTGFTDEDKTAFLKNVGCESCHGPCSEHIAHPHDLKVRALINPWKVAPGPLAQHQHELQVDKFCQSCHDIDNDVHWDFNKNWPKIIHMTPRAGRAAEGAQGPAGAEQQPTAEPAPAVPTTPQAGVRGPGRPENK